jgi:CubicO group peptidase (beta-lactamase class C family)
MELCLPRRRGATRWLAALVCAAAVAAAPVHAAAPCAAPLADADWAVAAPEAAGFDRAALCAVLEDAADEEAALHSLLVVRGGRLVAELYRTSPDDPISSYYGLGFASDVAFDADILHDVRSISKSVVGLLFGIVAAQGRLPSLASPALAAFPELADLRTPERDAVTVEHLLTMSSGLDWKEWNDGPLTSDETRLFWKSEPVRFLFDRPFAAAPGARFAYNGGSTAALAELIVRATKKPLVDVARDELFAPLGITRFEWVTDLRDRPLAFAGLRLRPRDMAKLGRLLLEGGRWRGRQVVPEAWVAESLRSHLDVGEFSIGPGTSGYGYQWWTGSTERNGRRLAWSAGVGLGGQRIFVVPELDLCVVFTAGEYGWHEISGIEMRLLEAILTATTG